MRKKKSFQIHTASKAINLNTRGKEVRRLQGRSVVYEKGKLNLGVKESIEPYGM